MIFNLVCTLGSLFLKILRLSIPQERHLFNCSRLWLSHQKFKNLPSRFPTCSQWLRTVVISGFENHVYYLG